MKVYQALASRVAAYHNCIKSGNIEWQAKHAEAADRIVRDYLPRGSGFDVGVNLLLDSSDGRKVMKFSTEFHRMDEHGGYAGWYSYTVKVTADMLFGFYVNARGRNIGGLCDYVEEALHNALAAEIPESDK